MAIALDTPQGSAPGGAMPQPPSGPPGIGQLIGQAQPDSSAENERRQAFQMEVQKAQLQLQALARMEPGFAPIARKCIDALMQGMIQVAGTLPEREESQSPYL